MAALPALVRALRYGDVRGTDTAGARRGRRASLLVRICGGAARRGDRRWTTTAAEALRDHVDEVHAATAC